MTDAGPEQAQDDERAGTPEPQDHARPPRDAPPAGGGGVSPRRAFWLSYALFFVLFALWSIGNPLTAAPDEPAHATKAAGVVRGQLVGEPVEGEPDGFGWVRVPNVIWQSQAYPICYYFKPDITAACEPEEPADPHEIVDAVTTASNYNPLYYLPVGMPTLLPLGEDMLFAMRLITAAMCAAALAWAVRSLAELRTMSWPVLGLAAAVTPMVVFLSSTISPAGPEICAAVGLWAGLLVTVHQPDPDRLRTRMAGVAVLASVLVNLRGMSPLFLALIVGTVVLSAPWANTWTALRDRRSWPWLGLVGVASIAALVWTRTAGSLPESIVAHPSWTFIRAAKTSIHATPTYLKNMVGEFGWVDTQLPLVMVWAWLAVIAAIAIAALVRGSWRQRVALALLGFLTLALPVVIHAWQAKYIGIVWQGRYFLPAAVGVPLLAGFILRGRPDGAVGATAPRSAHRLLPWLLGALLGGQVVALAVNLHRYAVGADGPWFGTVEDVWAPPVSVPVLLVACVAVVVWLFRLLRGVAVAQDVP